MKNVITLIVMVLVITTTACGQQRGGDKSHGKEQQGPPPTPTESEIKQMVNDLSQEILLSNGQKSKVLSLYISHFEEIKNKTKSGRLKREEMETLKTDFEKKVKAVLTKTQQEKYESYLKNHKSNLKSKKGKPGKRISSKKPN